MEQSNEHKELRKILVLRGLQNSGKTTFAKEWVNEDPERRVRFNRDDIRNMLGKYWVPSREDFISTIYWDILVEATNKSYDIVIDNMNLDDEYIKDIEAFIKETNTFLNLANTNFLYEIEVKDFFHIPLQTCINRDAQRENPVGEKVIRNTYNKYKDKILPWRYLN